jgi:integrase
MGIDTLQRQRWMGHSDAKMTDQTYLAIPREEHERAARQAADWWAANGLSSGTT